MFVSIMTGAAEAEIAKHAAIYSPIQGTWTELFGLRSRMEFPRAGIGLSAVENAGPSTRFASVGRTRFGILFFPPFAEAAKDGAPTVSREQARIFWNRDGVSVVLSKAFVALKMRNSGEEKKR
jgi:hypothetical protein